MIEHCRLGDIVWAYDRAAEIATVLAGHGVQVSRAGVVGGCGVLTGEDTLIIRAGGILIEPGDQVEHSAALCAEGRGQATN